jgi:ribosomal protein L37AE/L43A
MSKEAIRGHSLNSQSLISASGVDLEARQLVSFTCQKCTSLIRVPLALDAEIPDRWDCSNCGASAWRDGATVVADPDEKVGKTPFEMLLERRTRAELEVILEERLAYLRSRRGLDASGASV